ncbi:nicotinamide-nucleotide amidohydrolase family protein [Companilactobacillus kimchiensis]|uniref:CinA domain-containing protein n=1 Tax=Companilactobacillus kimchiensis TaxID=993692 RepID=A0A0R2LCD5_9LACO|nr:nicotinamide-nucleotide amidohydrolase family protein [Companilactobacillus kimchiensis]KRN99631.1 CinA domain-containing protein [Companilactobacillus kimchiensis]
MNNRVAEIFKMVEQADFEKGLPAEFVDYPQQTVDLLKEKHLKITAAESLTAGMFQATIASIPGASNIFAGGFVTYADAVKVQLLGMDPQLIEQYTVVSAPVAQAMAQLSAHKLMADIGVGFTGVAGPDPLEGNPVGTVFIGASNNKNNEEIVKEFHFSGSRQAIRVKSVLCGFALVQEII